MEQRTDSVGCKGTDNGPLLDQQRESKSNQSVGQRPLFALLIGINEYKDESRNLTGAIADCENMKDFLEKSLEEVHIEELHNKKATREGIEKAINGLANHDRISVGDPILIYYAGHGSEIDPPEHWNLPYGSRKIQMILPYDYDIGGQGLLDVTLRELLTRLSDNKGDNIVVILDSCSSGSGTRGSTEGDSDTFRIRGVKLPEDYAEAASLREQYFRNTGNGRSYTNSPDTHVLLAACRENEKARENIIGEPGGHFTTALIKTLRMNSFHTITYRELIRRLPNIGQQQHPQCEGVNENRFFFNKKCVTKVIAFHPLEHIPDDPGTYLLRAGQLHGICNNAEFAVYDKLDINSHSLGTLVVQEVPSVNTSKLCYKEPGKRFKIPQPAYGLETHKGDQARVRIAVSEDVDTKMKLLAEDLPGVILVNKDKDADLLLIEEDSGVKFKILRKILVDLGLKYTQSRPRSSNIQDVANLLRHAADFHFHLDRSFKATSERDFRLASQIKIAFLPLTKRGPKDYVPIKKDDGKDLDINRNGLVDVWVGDIYGIKFSNEGCQPVYFSLFSFHQSNFSIKLLHKPPTEQGEDTTPCLKPNEPMQIGYGFGEYPFHFTIEDPKQQTDVAFLKLFLSNSYHNIPGIEQCKLKELSNGRERDIDRLVEAFEHIWDTLTITIVQRRRK